MNKFWSLGAGGGSMFHFKIVRIFMVLAILSSQVSAGRRHQRLIPVAPTPEALREIADSMGAATYEELTVDTQGVESNKPRLKTLKGGVDDDNVEYQTYQGVVGRPGIDFPVLPSIPQTFFDCKKIATGYYADLETDCQVFHICDGGKKISFLCPNGTIFRQSNLICDWWFKVDCSESPGQYEESAEHLAEDQRRASHTEKQTFPVQTYDTIQTTNRRTDQSFDAGFNAHNHVTEYKAEASFNSVAKSGVPASSNARQNEQRNSQRATPRSFQVSSRQDATTNSRQYSSFERASKHQETKSAEENSRRSNFHNYPYTSTRRSISEYTDAAIYRSTTQAPKSAKELIETQVVAESASFINNKGRNNYNFSPSYNNKVRSTAVPAYSSTLFAPRMTRPTYTTTYLPGTKNYVEVTRSVSQTVTSTARPRYSPQSASYSISTTVGVPNEKKNDRYVTRSSSFDQNPTASVSFRSQYKSTTNSNSKDRSPKLVQVSEKANHFTVNYDAPANTNTWSSSKLENATFYAPTVPTVIPKVYNSSTNKFLATNWYSVTGYDSTTPAQETTSYPTHPTEPTVSEHAVEMLKTLEELELENIEPTTETEKYLGKRPGLFVPPSAGPNTLHSLAIYFATAVDNLVSTQVPTTVVDEIKETTLEEENITEKNEESLTSILTRKTLDKYSNLFKNSSDDDSLESTTSEEIQNNDLEPSQSRGPLASSPQIRELAQVFTHALSAYLQDPETFRKVLSEIRPTEPTTIEEAPSTSRAIIVEDTTPSNDFYSVAKEEDEVLDFSDVSKNSPQSTLTPYENTGSTGTDETKAYNVDLIKNQLLLSTGAYRHQSPTYYSNTKNKTPASNLVTHQTDDEDNSQNEIRQGKSLSTTPSPPTSNAVAIEINGGLSESNKKLPHKFESKKQESAFNSTDEFDSEKSYFPLRFEDSVDVDVPRYGGFQNNSSEVLSPYGAGVKPSNSTPINGDYSGSLSATEAIPLHWGDEISTRTSPSQINPSAPSLDLVPPSTISRPNNQLDSVEMSVINSFVPEDLNDLAVENKTTSYIYTTTEEPTTTTSVSDREKINNKYKSHSADRGKYYNNYKLSNDNDEQLQRAHSQSFISSANQLGRRGKKIENQSKSNSNTKDDEKHSDNKTVTLRTSNGVILSLPTLKDILSKPTSTVPATVTTEQQTTSISTQQTTTTVEETTTGTTPTEETTQNIETTTYFEYPRTSTRSQSSTSNYNIWSTSAALGHIWQTTVFLDPMTINDGLTNDADTETILPSANTYRSGNVRHGENSKLETESIPTTTYVATQDTGASQYSVFTTPYSTVVENDYTTKAPDDLTTYFTETQTFDAPQTTYSSYTTEGRKETISDNYQTTAFKSQREGKALETSSPNLLLNRLNASEVDQTMMTKAKEMFGGLNESSANTLMNVMKNADKNKTVRRLILLLVQTCDDDHNKTVEASRTALLDALMKIPTEETESTVPQNPTKDNVEIESRFENQETTPVYKTEDYYNVRRSDEIIDTENTKYPDVYATNFNRKGKTLDRDTTSFSTYQPTTDTREITTVTTQASTTTSTEVPLTSTTVAPILSTRSNRRGNRKYYVKTSKAPLYTKQTQEPSSFTSAERGSVSSLEDQSVPSDTRALELLRSLYSLAARWG